MNQNDLRLPNEEELALLQQEMANVRPFAAPAVPPARAFKPLPKPRVKEHDAENLFESLLAESPDGLLDGADEMRYLRPGVAKKQLQKLRQKQYRFDEELDLHGLTLAEAEQATRSFLANAQANCHQSLLIIHGKGHRSGGDKPILKNWLNTYLRRRNDVNAFCSAQPSDGGSGAIYLLLRR